MNFRNKLLISLNALFNHQKFKKIYFVLLFLMVTIGIIDGEGYTLYPGRDARKICDKYVLDQKLYLHQNSKDIIDQWSSRYFQGLNEYIRGFIKPSFSKIKEYEKFRRELSSLIESTKGLYMDTILFRGEIDVDIESRFRIGEENIFSGFIATSFSEKKARNFSKSLSNSGYLIKIRAKKNTKGIAINGNEVGRYRGQKEWLLNENQRYMTLNIDEKKKIIEIKLL